MRGRRKFQTKSIHNTFPAAEGKPPARAEGLDTNSILYGEDLERLGDDAAPEVWRRYGVFGLVRLLADIAVRLPAEYLTEIRIREGERTYTVVGLTRDVRAGFLVSKPVATVFLPLTPEWLGKSAAQRVEKGRRWWRWAWCSASAARLL